MKYWIHIVAMAVMVLAAVTSCEKKEETTPSSETKLTKIVFAANDSIPGLKKATFDIDFSQDTAVVCTEDSLPVGTRIDSVVTTFYFSTTIGYAMFISGEDTTLVTTADTLDFTPSPCYLHVVSQDMLHERDYKIYVNVHKVDPDLYVWNKTQEQLFSGNCDVHAEKLNGTIQLYTQDGIRPALYRSADGRTWTGPFVPTGLPASANVRQIVRGKNGLYYTEDNILYSTADGLSWTSTDCSGLGFDLESMLFYYNDSVWAIVRDAVSGELWFATMAEGGVPAKQNQIGAINGYYRFAYEHFPISDFCTAVYYGISGRLRAMVMGGFDAEGKALNSRWNLEWIETDAGTGYYRFENFTIEQPAFSAITGAALCVYDGRLLLFGALENGSDIVEHPVLESLDEGMNWSVPDTAQNRLPDEYSVRQRQALAITDDMAIILVGGQNRTTSFADVWRGKKNLIEEAL